MNDPGAAGAMAHRLSSAFRERYEVLSLLGEGGMGLVFAARQLPSGTRVALKFIKAASGIDRDRFAREGRVLAGLDHPHVLRVLETAISRFWRPSSSRARRWRSGTLAPRSRWTRRSA